MRKGLSDTSIHQEPKDNASNSDKEKYYRYKTYKKVLRDIIRTVSQMKRLIERNSIDDLGKIKFKYKIGNEELGIKEIIVPVDELNKNLHYKERFVIYVVDSVKIYNGKIYINSYETGGKTITTSFDYPSKLNKTGINKGDMIISFGRISYYEQKNKYYLNTLSDLNIDKINDKELIERFNNKKMISFTSVKQDYTLEKKENNIVDVDLLKSSSLKDITPYKNTVEQEQEDKVIVIKEVVKNDIPSGSNHKYKVESKEQISNISGFFNKIFRKISNILSNR